MFDGYSLIFLYGGLIAFVLTLMLIPAARKFALSVEFIDRPGGRKHHEDVIPPIGGLVVFPVYMLISALAGLDMTVLWPLFAGIVLLLVVGGLDDYRGIDAWIKFASQFAAAGLVVIGGQAQLYGLGDMFGAGELYLGWMSVPFSVVAVVLLINAVNLMDGLDGLAAGKGVVVLCWLIIAAILADQSQAALIIAPMLGALAGFLAYNLRHPFRRRASVFLGDAGSQALGLVLGWFCIGLTQIPDPIVIPITIAWFLALPIMDACGQFFRRVREGRHPFSPDRGHFHHHFIHAGLSDGQATAVILCVGFILGGIGYGGVWIGVPVWVLTYAWIALLFIHMALSQNPERYTRLVAQLVGKPTFL